MSKFNRILAIIALVFVGSASVFLVMFMFNRELFPGLDHLLMYTAGIGLLLFVYLWLVKKKVDREEKYLKEAEEESRGEADVKENEVTVDTDNPEKSKSTEKTDGKDGKGK